MKSQRGFTLIEMMVVVAIIAILTAIAIPNYMDYVTRTKLTEAKTNLAAMRTKLEQYYQDQKTYVGACAAGTVAPLPSSADSKYFTIACPALTLTPTTFLVTATGSAASGTSGFAFNINETNLKTTVSVPSGWAVPSPNTCWVSKKGGAC